MTYDLEVWTIQPFYEAPVTNYCDIVLGTSLILFCRHTNHTSTRPLPNADHKKQ